MRGMQRSRGGASMRQVQHMLQLAFCSICCYAAHRETTMAITIRNKVLEARMKDIGAKLNKGPTDVLKTLLDGYAKADALREQQEKDALIAQRKAAMKELMEEARRHATDESRAAVHAAMEDLYDERGLPK
jgi:hypothetical protein